MIDRPECFTMTEIVTKVMAQHMMKPIKIIVVISIGVMKHSVVRVKVLDPKPEIKWCLMEDLFLQPP